MSSATTSPLGPAATELRTKWGWFVALGAGLLILGIIALGNLVAATVVSVLYIGALMIAGGIAQNVQAFRVNGWGGVLFWLLSGILYGVAGVLAFYDPLLAAAAMTLILALALVISGGLRIGVGFRSRPASGWAGWLRPA